jgi:hypothetical protein
VDAVMLFPLFLYYKRDRVGHESPVAVQSRLIRQFGIERARALITLFKQTAIPARKSGGGVCTEQRLSSIALRRGTDILRTLAPGNP